MRRTAHVQNGEGRGTHEQQRQREGHTEPFDNKHTHPTAVRTQASTRKEAKLP